MAVKTQVIPEIIAYLKQIGSAPEPVPYERLLADMREAGHHCYLKEVSAVATPDASVLVHFDVMVGPSPDAMERLDGLTTRIAQGLPHVSLSARLQAEVALVFMLFGRLPPQVQQVAEAPVRPDLQQGGQMNGHDDDDPLEPEWKSSAAEPEQEYLDEPEDEPVLNVVARREADGVPIFVDLYDSGERAAVLIAAVLDEIETFLGDAASTAQIDAVIIKNPTVKTFLKDLGTGDDIKRLLDMVTKRKGQIAGGVNPRRPSEAPRRRAAGARAN